MQEEERPYGKFSPSAGFELPTSSSSSPASGPSRLITAVNHYGESGAFSDFANDFREFLFPFPLNLSIPADKKCMTNGNDIAGTGLKNFTRVAV